MRRCSRARAGTGTKSSHRTAEAAPRAASAHSDRARSGNERGALEVQGAPWFGSRASPSAGLTSQDGEPRQSQGASAPQRSNSADYFLASHLTATIEVLLLIWPSLVLSILAMWPGICSHIHTVACMVIPLASLVVSVFLQSTF